MSASKKKQERKANAEANEELFSKKKNGKGDKKESNLKYIIAGITVALVLVLAIVMLIYQSAVAPNAAAMTIGGEKIYPHELNYYYINSYTNFINQIGADNAAQIFGLDTNQSLKNQTSIYGGTWHDYFLQSAENSAQQIHMLSDAARAEGVVLNDTYEEYVASELSGLRDYVSENGYDINAYLKAMYGNRMNEAEYERLVRNGYLASQYQEDYQKKLSESYTEDDLMAYYNENSKDFDTVTYRRYLVSANTTDSMTDNERNAALNAARDTATTMASAITNEGSFIAEVVAQKNRENAAKENADETSEYTSAEAESDTLQSGVTYSSFGTSTETAVAQADWLFDAARKTNDVTTIDATTGTYVMFFESRTRNDYNTVDIRHILVSFESFDADGNEVAEHEHSDDETVTDAQNEAAKAKAESILDEWQAGAATEESFAALAKQYTDDSNGDVGGLYEEVYKGQMVANFNDWCFGSGREPGDTGIVSTNYGYHVMYFSGKNTPYYLVQARNAKTSADYSTWMEAQLEKYAMKDKSGISAVGISGK